VKKEELKVMWVEDILEKYPDTQSFFEKKHIVCIQCGEPVWGTVDELIKSKIGKEEDGEKILEELEEFVTKTEKKD